MALQGLQKPGSSGDSHADCLLLNGVYMTRSYEDFDYGPVRLQSTDREAALAQPFKAYLELDKERPFFDALGDFRSHIAKCEEHVATALSEV